MRAKPDCYECVHRRDIPGNYHSSCVNRGANARGSGHGIARGWFLWPISFDPVWLIHCDGFKARGKADV